jgi:hypothetical protein
MYVEIESVGQQEKESEVSHRFWAGRQKFGVARSRVVKKIVLQSARVIQ